MNKTLVIITGPVGAGKSTVAQEVARALQSRNLSTAVIDLDEVYCMARQQADFNDRAMWATARRAAAALTESFYASGLNTVIVEGGFLSAIEYAELRQYLATEVNEFFFTVFTSASTALYRAQSDPDPGRVVSHLADVQANLYVEFCGALSFLRETSVIIEADSRPAELLAEIMVQKILLEK